jgi:hypothetical protein
MGVGAVTSSGYWNRADLASRHGETFCGLNRRSFRDRIIDLAELALEDAALTVHVPLGETIRVGDGTLMVVTEVVETPHDPAHDGVVIVEPAQSPSVQ